MTSSSLYKARHGQRSSEMNLQGGGLHSSIQLSRSASSCLSHIDLDNGVGHATMMTTDTAATATSEAVADPAEINNSLAAIGFTRSLYNSQKSKIQFVVLSK